MRRTRSFKKDQESPRKHAGRWSSWIQMCTADGGGGWTTQTSLKSPSPSSLPSPFSLTVIPILVSLDRCGSESQGYKINPMSYAQNFSRLGHQKCFTRAIMATKSKGRKSLADERKSDSDHESSKSKSFVGALSSNFPPSKFSLEVLCLEFINPQRFRIPIQDIPFQ